MKHKDYTTSETNIQSIQVKKRYTHLTKTDRQNIELYLKRKNDPKHTGPKITYDYIAKEIGVNKSTISREIKRGLFSSGYDASGPIEKYDWYVGERIAQEHRNRSHQKTKLTDDDIELKRLAAIINREKISPEDAIDKYEKHYQLKFPVCLKTVYKYIKRKILTVKKGTLRFYHTIKPKKARKAGKRAQKGDNISQRPEEAENRSVIGHWEGDTVYSSRSGGKECLLTFAERRYRLLLMFKLEDRTAGSVVKKLDEIEKALGTARFVQLFQSVTFDNGLEFSKIAEMEASVLEQNTRRIKTYFANAYHSWERGTNENTIGL